jgi:hypothetical protein
MIASNRSNGRRGRGPRTAAGKASSSRNALRHGLAASLLDEPAMCAKVEALARAIAGAGADTARLNQARIIAEAEFDLVRIQEAKVRMINSYLLEVSAPEGAVAGDEIAQKSQADEAGSESVDIESKTEDTEKLNVPPSIEVLRQLARIDRYECGARARRRRAIGAFLMFQPIE